MFVFFCQCVVPIRAGGGVLVSTRALCSSSSSPHSTTSQLSTGQVGEHTPTHCRIIGLESVHTYCIRTHTDTHHCEIVHTNISHSVHSNTGAMNREIVYHTNRQMNVDYSCMLIVHNAHYKCNIWVLMVCVCVRVCVSDGPHRPFPWLTRQLRLWSYLLPTVTPETTQLKWIQEVLLVHALTFPFVPCL